MLSALAYAQEWNLTHNDLRPDTIFVSASGKVKLADFCLNHAGILGTNPYKKETECGHKADIFAVGAILHEMCTYE